MVAAGTLVLGVRRAAKFASPPDDGIIQQPALLEVGQQRADRLVGGHMLHVLGHVGVLIPRGIVAVVGVIYLNVAHPGFAQAPGHQAVTAKVIGRLLVDPVHLQRLGIFISQIENLRRVVLHAPRSSKEPITASSSSSPGRRLACSALMARNRSNCRACALGSVLDAVIFLIVASLAGLPAAQWGALIGCR